MSENNKLWWRDPKFVIPSILIPVLALAIPLLLPGKVTEKLSVSIEIEDPRRSDGLLGMQVENNFHIGNQAIKDIATELSNRITERIESHTPTNPEMRKRIDVFINQEQDGSLYIDGPDAQKVALHLTRFPEIKTLLDLLNDEYPHLVIQGYIDPGSRMVVKEDLTRRQDQLNGVFRVILTAPGYRDAFILLEVKDGKMYGGYPDAELISNAAIKFPMSISLYPSSSKSGRLTIAIDPFSPCTEQGTHKPMVEDIEKAIQSDLEVRLQQLGFSIVTREPEMKLGFHPYRLKNVSPPLNHIYSDFLIKGSCRWMK